MILGLSALAVVQPLLDLFGNNPEFFVAGNYSTSQIVLFALAITIVPPALGIGLTALATAIDRRLGQVVFVAVIGVLATAFGLALLRTIGVDQLVVVALLAVLIGAGIVVLVLRTKGVRLLVSYLAVANLFFLATFLFFSPASELVAGASSGRPRRRRRPDAWRDRSSLLVLDELPAATFMRADGSLNAERYPGFAELASVSTWFRNASSQYNLTHRAVPSILDGNLADPDDLPTYADHPRNLFSLLGDVVPVRRYESVTDLCPPDVCAPPPRQPLGQAFEDASIVYGHRLLPSALRDELPAIDNSWGSYGAADEPDDDLVRQVREATDDGVDARRARLRQVAGPARRRAQPARPGGDPARRDRRHHRRAGAARRARGPAAPAMDAVTRRGARCRSSRS